jgi:hypothetical protein
MSDKWLTLDEAVALFSSSNTLTSPYVAFMGSFLESFCKVTRKSGTIFYDRACVEDAVARFTEHTLSTL